MTKPYSKDLRDRLIAAVSEGMSCWVTVGYGTIWQFFAREGISYKKACCRWSKNALTSRAGA